MAHFQPAEPQIDQKLVRQLRASVVLLGPMLARFKKSFRPEKGDKIEYLAMAHPDKLSIYKSAQTPCLLAAAIWVGKTRLIDNLLVK